jgi:hypothetical protein
MVTNSFNRRRANKGTPPICASKPKPPVPGPPFTCVCTLLTGFDLFSKSISTTLVVCTSLVPAGTSLSYNIDCQPPLVKGPPYALTNCAASGGGDFIGATLGITYTLTAEIFIGYHIICNRWSTQTAA